MTSEELSGLNKTFQLEKGQSLLIEVGPMKLVIHHDNNEWILAYDWDFNDKDDVPAISYGNSQDFEHIDKNILRFAYHQSTTRLDIKARLADRSVVAKPRIPFYLLARQELWLYVSSPVWLSISIGDESTLLTELPVHRPSDTWFGSNTIEGEVAYSVKTHARLNLEEINTSMHRAITPVRLVNETDQHLFLERISIPAPSLSLFEDQHYHLWSSCITLLKEIDSDTTSMKIESTPPSQAENARLISDPRMSAPANVFVKTMRSLFR